MDRQRRRQRRHPTGYSRSVLTVVLLIYTAAAAAACTLRPIKGRSLASLSRIRHHHQQSTLLIIRGGESVPLETTGVEEENDDGDEAEMEKAQDENNADDENEDDEEEDEDPIAAAIPSQPLSITFKTNLGNSLIDASLELLVSRSRNIESVKATLSRMLPGRPPVELLSLLKDGMELQDDLLVDELADDDDEDDEDDESSPDLTLVLDMVPPVNPKFATEFDRATDMTVSELLDAYASNVAAMMRNGQALLSPTSPAAATTRTDTSSQGLLSAQLRQQAQLIRESLVESYPQSALELLESTETPAQKASSAVIAEQRGQRYRSGKGGATSSIKRAIQTNLNINWPVTIRNFFLFLFFGIFGGRNALSRNLLLLGAPMCFVLQARPVKIALKQAFYACRDPPAILLSLLPAPQQAILSFDAKKAYQDLYGKEYQDDENDDEDDEEEIDDEDDEDDDDDDE